MTDTKLNNYLLDTNIISELVKYNANFNVLKKMVEHSSDCAIAAITLQELSYGPAKLEPGAKKDYLTDFVMNDVLENFPVISYGKKAAFIHARIKADSEKNGTPVPADDSFIAAIALAENMTLVTRNTKHFEPLAELFGLKTENWFEE